jgi:hypothetical protein
MPDLYNIVWEKLATLILPAYCNDVGQGSGEDTNPAKLSKDNLIKDFLKFHLPSAILNKDTKDVSNNTKKAYNYSVFTSPQIMLCCNHVLPYTLRLCMKLQNFLL